MQTVTPPRGPLLIKWIDCCSDTDAVWKQRDDISSCKGILIVESVGWIVESVGWIVGEDDECVLLASSLNPEQYGSDTFIARCCIKEQIAL